jgi:DNA-binding beta-propeller fold protein YncE
MFPRNAIAVAALALAGTLGAQETQFGGLVSGFVFDEQARAVREITGIPGAAYLGRKLVGGQEGSVSPDGKLVVVHEGDTLSLVRPGDGGTMRLAVVAGAVTDVAWGADAVAVAAAGRVQLWTGLGGQPEEVPVAQVPGDVLALAVDAGRRAVVVGVEGHVYYATSERSRLLQEAGQPEGLAIVANNLYVADRARREVLVLRNFATAPEAALVGNQAQGLAEPVAVAADGGTLWVADAAGKLFAFDLASSRLARVIDTDFQPARLEALGRNLYRMDARKTAQSPVQILQLGPEPAVYFVPAEASLEE